MSKYCNNVFSVISSKTSHSGFVVYWIIKESLNNYSTSARWIWFGHNHLMPSKREWNNCFIRNAPKIRRILPDFIYKNNRFSACFQFWAEAYKYHIWRAWYNGSDTMMAKPIRALELHYPMIQFLIISVISLGYWLLRISQNHNSFFHIYQETRNLS